ncbi:CheR-type MCP methyltransferase [Orenia metallireducens]|jgi:chemotaxis protein methyltransferase CheR|uniref:protein-glutamate O-methyltransferase n=1 Tax=Orenia metallireducens TaxID=1413210 RepID=A0A285HG03_9FIRM|nr:protein-glutamate O-methyltransferase CheR [Orenia metallireducens]PRX27476.1 CheR-type MCP methyltransferase [Orenia metallireducens]SNY34672.1 MCP methyltransferase, CheR-type [Orenia metallireducens]
MNYNYLLDSELFQKFSKLIFDRIGINLSDKKKAMVTSRLSKRLRQLKLADFEDYYNYLNSNQAELVQLYNLLTTNVTRFFREEYHFQFLQDKVLPQLATRKDKTLRVWSAGCSSGEEAYSLAIVLKEFFSNKGWDIRILATDINTEVLEIGKEGIYHFEQVKDIPYNLLTKYFKLGTGENQGLFKAKDSLRKMIKFQRLNLNQSGLYPIQAKLDFIFCRNVFIYFKEETKNKVLEGFYQQLKDRGYLFLGHSESIPISHKFSKEWALVAKTTYQKISYNN